MNTDFDINNDKKLEDPTPRPLNQEEVPDKSELSKYETLRSTTPGLFKLEDHVIEDLRSRWSSIQAQFVDQPCTSIEQADALVTDALERIQQTATKYHDSLRGRWYDHQDVSTEDIRLTLQDYRAFLNDLFGQ